MLRSTAAPLHQAQIRRLSLPPFPPPPPPVPNPVRSEAGADQRRLPPPPISSQSSRAKQQADGRPGQSGVRRTCLLFLAEFGINKGPAPLLIMKRKVMHSAHPFFPIPCLQAHARPAARKPMAALGGFNEGSNGGARACFSSCFFVSLSLNLNQQL